MREPIYAYDPVAVLTNPETIATFLTDVFETGDAVHIAQALELLVALKR